MRKRTALIDVDGVLADIHRALRLKITFPFVHTWNSSENSDEANRQLNEIKSQRSFWEDVPEIPSGFAVVDMIKKAGYEVQFVSGIPKCGGQALVGKLNWIKKRYPYDPFHLTQDRKIFTPDILVDDGPDFVVPFLGRNYKAKVIMPRWDYNEDYLGNLLCEKTVMGYNRGRS